MLFSLFIVIVVNEQLFNSPFQQSYQRSGQLRQGIQKNFQYQQKYSPYLKQNSKKINSKLGNNPSTNFKNIPANYLYGTTGALVTIQLQQYSNPNLALPNGYTCACPSGIQCPYLQGGSVTCFFSFTIVMSASNQSIQIIESPFIMVPKSPINAGIFDVVNMTVKPNTIDIIVHHLGIVIDETTGNLEYFNRLILVDTFVIPLDHYQATPYGTTPNIIQQTISGQILGTSLQLAYNVQCNDKKYGSNCDLKCMPASINKLYAACISIVTGMDHICKYAGDSIEIFDCLQCPFGLTTNQTKCNTVPIEPINNKLVSPLFRIWTIVLSCILGIAMIFIILLIITYVMVKNCNEAKSAMQNRRHMGNIRSTIYRTHPTKSLLTPESGEWQRSKIKAITTHDNGAFSRAAKTGEPIQNRYVRTKIVSTGRREAHV